MGIKLTQEPNPSAMIFGLILDRVDRELLPALRFSDVDELYICILDVLSGCKHETMYSTYKLLKASVHIRLFLHGNAYRDLHIQIHDDNVVGYHKYIGIWIDTEGFSGVRIGRYCCMDRKYEKKSMDDVRWE